MAFQFHRARRQGRGPTAAIRRANDEAQAAAKNARAGRKVIVVTQACSGLTRCRLPKFPLLRGAEFFVGPFAAVSGKPIEMPRRTALRNRLFPLRVEPAEFIEPHQDGVQRSGRNAGLATDGIAVVPVAWTGEERLEDGESLTRGAEANAHSLTLHK